MKISHMYGVLLLGLCACTTYHTETTYLEAPTEKDAILLQEPKTREIVQCTATRTQAAEDCAAMFESQGFVKITDIPQQTANYDLLKTNTYPTRRWREGEKNPRW